VLLVSETALPQLADVCTVIKVPPLRVRPSDVRAMQAYFLRSVARQRDLPGIRLSDEAGGGRVDRERATQDGF
jgi:transcriptional regulator with AAA-type ATPase domain